MDELIQRLNGAAVRYAVIGGQAIRFEGMPRFTMDWDFFVPPRDEANFGRLNAVLQDELDMPVEPLGSHGENFIQTYQTRWGVVQFHLGVPGLPKFDDVEARAVMRTTESGTPVRCVSGIDLLSAKLAANRPQDQVDIAFLQQKKENGTLK